MATLMPRARTTHERGTFAQASEPARTSDLAARQTVRFACPRGHDFTIPFADNADMPATWECRRHGIEGRLKGNAQLPRPVKMRCHWDMVLERRRVSELAQLLSQQLKDLRAGRLVSVEQWLAMRRSNEPIAGVRAPTSQQMQY